MALNKYKIGECITLFTEKCGIPHLSDDNVSGINRDKEFFEPSHQIGSDTSNYKNVPPGFFACNIMHVGRDRVLPIAFNHSSTTKHVSPAYTVFSIKKDCGILDEYFFMMLKSSEMDRLFWFHADSSIRDGLPWEAFCNIEINVPDIHIQQRFVSVYDAMIANQKCYKDGLDDLKLLCDAFIEQLIKQNKLQEIGPYITRYDVRNENNCSKNVKGISTSKEFRDPTSKVNKKELSKYKVVKPRQFGFVQTTHNEKVFAYAFNNTNENIVISSVNEVFSTDESILRPEYLAMFFNRTEFDRYARFHSWGTARETFTWNDLQKVKIPIVSIDIQNSIACIYAVYKERKYINERLLSQIKTICPILIRGALEAGGKDDGEFEIV